MNSENGELRKKVWFASKEVGQVVENGLLDLVMKYLQCLMSLLQNQMKLTVR